MVAYRYLGSALTNANGVATFDYQGTGAGEIDVIASLDKPIVDGSIVSGTFPVFDCYRHDDGTISSHNDIWTGITNTDLTREAEYTTIKEKTSGTTATLTFTNIPLKNYRIECDVYQVDGTQDEWFITVLKQDYTAITSADAKLGEWKHISLDLTDIAPNSRVRLNTGGSCTELRFKNFMLYPTGDNDVITINSSNPVIQSTDTTNITGSLFFNGVLQKNTNIDVYKNGSKVDTISTGSTGVASYTYTGTGAGKTEFQFKYGSILSETYSILDCIKYDGGTINNHNDIWDTLDANSQFDRYDEYSILSEKNTVDANLYLSQLPTSCVLEFELSYVDGTMGNGFISLYDGNNYKSYFSIQNLGYPTTLDTRFFKLKVTYNNGSVTCTNLDDTSKTKTNSYTGDINRIKFNTGGGTTALKIRDFKVYPI